MNVATIVGARPQIIKASAVSHVLAERGDEETMVHTGQHYDDALAGNLYRSLGIAPSIDLGVAGGTNTAMLGRMLTALDPVLGSLTPDVVLVYGDTNSTLAGALAAADRQLPLVHVEAGLRSRNLVMAEERNRLMVDAISGLLLCPTRTAVDNLASEHAAGRVLHVGDVMFDVALQARARLRLPPPIRDGGPKDGPVVMTLHRAENVDQPERLRELLAFVRHEAGGRPVIFPVHPRAARAIAAAGVDTSGLTLIEPAPYDEMVSYMARASLVMTDSGGLQKEAYFHAVPCITLREETEWPETIEAGWNRLWRAPDWSKPRTMIGDYGDGHAAEACVGAIDGWLGGGE